MLGALLDEVLKLQGGRTHILADPGMKRRSRIVEHEIPNVIQPWVTALAPHWIAAGSGGKGSAAEVPWTRYFDPELSPKAGVGWYVVYLFTGDGSAVYLSLMQGTTSWNTATKDFLFIDVEDLRLRVEWAREAIMASGLKPAAFQDIPGLGDNRLARGYVAGTVHAIRYLAGGIPSDDQLQADVVAMGELLKVLYAAEAEAVYLPGDEAPEIADADLAVDEAAGNVRHRPKGGGQGYRLNTAEKLAIERHAVKMAIEHFENEKYVVEDTGAKEPFDLLATKTAEEIYIEVKGTASLGEEVILTRGEVEHHRKHYPNNALYVVHSIVLDRSGSEPVASGGVPFVIRGWEIEDEALTPISYRYRVVKKATKKAKKTKQS